MTGCGSELKAHLYIGTSLNYHASDTKQLIFQPESHYPHTASSSPSPKDKQGVVDLVMK